MTSPVRKILKLIFNCHQIPERSFFIAGHPFPLCARCTGILAGMVIFPLFLLFKVEIPCFLSLLFIFPLVFDGGIQLIFCIMSNNIRRFLTGIFFALGFLSLVMTGVKAVIFLFLPSS